MGSVGDAAVLVAATVLANTFESYLGAALQGKEGAEWLTNDVVNAIQICLASALAIGIKLAASGAL